MASEQSVKEATFEQLVSLPKEAQGPKVMAQVQALCLKHSVTIDKQDNSGCVVMRAHSEASLKQALRDFGTMEMPRSVRYPNIRIYFVHKADAPFAVSFLGFPDSTFAGPAVPFGSPVLSGGHVAAALGVHLGLAVAPKLAGLTLMSTSYEMATDGPSLEAYYFHRIMLRVHVEGETPTGGALLVPLEREGHGVRPPCTQTELVSFIICCRPRDVGLSPEVLMVIERNGCLFLPAGHVERGESFEEAAVREALEESGLTMLCGSLHPVDLIYGGASYDPKPLACAPLYVVYSADVDVTARPIEAVDGLGVMWIPLDFLLRALHEGKGTTDPSELSQLKNYQFRKPWELYPIISRYASICPATSHLNPH